jgi:hypothetical protein
MLAANGKWPILLNRENLGVLLLTPGGKHLLPSFLARPAL